MRRLAPVAHLVLLVGTLAVALGTGALGTGGSGSVAAEDRLARAEALYRLNCAVCHGATGLGYAEAREAFPADHRRCTRCHKPNNPAVMALEDITDDHDLFSLGDPPALRGPEAPRAFATTEALKAYLRAAMPRYEPGRLADEEYALLAELLLSWR